MAVKPLRRTHRVETRPPFECVALLLQGGGALGAYQAGVYEALAEAGLHPDWVSGISIGAVNSAIIAGNPPEKAVARLREFWEAVTVDYGGIDSGKTVPPVGFGDHLRQFLNQTSAGLALTGGIPGFFNPRLPSPWFYPRGTRQATSYYDTAPLRETLERLVDFDRINRGRTRLTLSAVNVRSGNFVDFDTTTHVIAPEHVMASGALPPGFPAVEIEGELYWDGGLVSNTPLDWVVESKPRRDTLAFQVDLWSARGEFPRSMAEVLTRQKEILYSSRTRALTSRFRYAQRMRYAAAALLEQLPEELKDSPAARHLAREADRKVYSIVHLIYHARDYEGDSKDYEFSRLSMEEHWRTGYNDTVRTLRHPEVLERPDTLDCIRTFDVAVDGRI